MRQIVLDTETTGLYPDQGHRIIEIGCVELNHRRLTGNNYHVYIQPDREIDEGAQQVHGISNEFLADKPRFADIVEDLVEYLKGAELIIHNAPFDVGFLNHELKLVGEQYDTIETYCQVVDTLVMARKQRPGQKNNLDALCKFYDVNNSQRELHGALLDAELLSEVYLHMTGGQTQIDLAEETADDEQTGLRQAHKLAANRAPLRVVLATAEEQEAHQAILDKMGDGCRWQ